MKPIRVADPAMGERLDEERIRVGISVRQMAKVCGASQRLAYYWVQGTIFPNAQHLALLQAQGADIGYILSGRRTVFVD